MTSTRLRWLPKLSETASVAAPALAAVLRLDGLARWEEDLGVARGLGVAHSGWEGSVSSALSGLFAALPFGNQVLRAALLGVLFQSVAALVVYRLALHLLEAMRPAPTNPLLALGAATAAASSAAWQGPGLAVGGVAVAGLLALLVVACVFDGSARLRTFFPVLAGLSLAEDFGAFVVIVSVLAVSAIVRSRLPTAPMLVRGVAILVATALICSLRLLLQPLAAQPTLHLGYVLEASGATAINVGRGPGVGWYFVSLALVGALMPTLRSRLMPRVLPLIAPMALCWLWKDAAVAFVGAATTAVLAAVGFRVCVVWLRGVPIGFRKHGRVALGFVHLCAVLWLVEEAAFQTESRTVTAAEEWTERAVGRLPYGSLVLVQSEDVAWRLWAARVSTGLRPDVTVVTSSLLDRGNIAHALLRDEPDLGPLVRDLNLHGQASEFALSRLADKRPLYVQLRSSWDRKLLRHLDGSGIWFRFAPHAQSVSDRAMGVEKTRAALRRVYGAARSMRGVDAITLERLEQDLQDHLLLAMALGERTNSETLYGFLRRLAPANPQLARFEKRLDSRLGALSAADVLR